MRIIIVFSFFVCSMFYACNGSSGNETVLKDEIVSLKERIRQLESASIQQSETGKIKHTVMFCLKHNTDAPETGKFLHDGQRILSAIPVVENFQVFNQVSPKNEYHFCFSMEFSNEAAYKAYNEHPEHVKFVNERWVVEVSKFLEGDFENY